MSRTKRVGADDSVRPRGAAALHGPLWEGAVGAADWGGEQVPCDISPFGGASLRFFSDIHKLQLHFLCK